MLATQLISRVYDAFGIDYSFLDLFEAPTPAGMAAALRARTAAGPPSAGAAPAAAPGLAPDAATRAAVPGVA